jgi:hypothetical protein
VTIPPDAIIARSKLTGYLLVRQPQNDKSQYLLRAGFDQTNPDLLEAAIRKTTAGANATSDRVNEHGTFYTVHGLLSGPSGVELAVKLVWLQRVDGLFSFVTLVPD